MTLPRVTCRVRRLRAKMLLIPVCFLLQRGPETLYRFLCFAWGDDAVANSHAGHVLDWLEAVCSPIQGVSTSGMKG